MSIDIKKFLTYILPNGEIYDEDKVLTHKVMEKFLSSKGLKVLSKLPEDKITKNNVQSENFYVVEDEVGVIRLYSNPVIIIRTSYESLIEEARETLNKKKEELLEKKSDYEQYEITSKVNRVKCLTNNNKHGMRGV